MAENWILGDQDKMYVGPCFNSVLYEQSGCVKGRKFLDSLRGH